LANRAPSCRRRLKRLFCTSPCCPQPAMPKPQGLPAAEAATAKRWRLSDQTAFLQPRAGAQLQGRIRSRLWFQRSRFSTRRWADPARSRQDQDLRRQCVHQVTARRRVSSAQGPGQVGAAMAAASTSKRHRDCREKQRIRTVKSSASMWMKIKSRAERQRRRDVLRILLKAAVPKLKGVLIDAKLPANPHPSDRRTASDAQGAPVAESPSNWIPTDGSRR